MGNSLLDVCVFGRRAGKAAAIYIPDTIQGKPNLKHVEMWNKDLDEVGLNGKVHSPILLPNYTRVV